MSERPEMRLRVHGLVNALWSEELAAVPKSKRTWSSFRYISFWVGMSLCIPTYMLASGLIAVGMNWKQALATILLGNLIVLLPMLLNAHAGAKFGIPFAVYVRASFGVLGAQVPAMLRALVACGWFGIHCWIGGKALFFGARIGLPGLGEDAIWACFLAFWLLNLALARRRIAMIKSLQVVSAAFLLLAGLALLFWMVGWAGSIGIVLSVTEGVRGAEFHTGTQPDFWTLFVPSLTAVVGFWAAMVLNISDYTRCARSQRAQMVGQAIGLPAAMTLYSFIGIVVTSAAMLATPDHRAIWNPVELIAAFHQPAVAMIGLAVVFLATLNTNLAANVMSPSTAIANLRPNAISLRTGALITGVLGIAWMPWRLVADPESYIYGWLVGTSGLLGPIAGIMIVDYFVVRGRSLNPDELYVRDGKYEYRDGYNPPAMVALAAGLVVALVGLFAPRLHWLYECAWFAGFMVAALVYLALMRGPDVRALIPPNPLLIPVEGFEPESPMA